MSEETTRNFWAVMQSFQWPEPKPISYRLYHDDDGRPLVYTMEALPGNYIEIDQATYTLASGHVRVRNGQLLVLESRITISKLRPDPNQGTPCDCRDICIVVDSNQPHQKWRKTTNDSD